MTTFASVLFGVLLSFDAHALKLSGPDVNMSRLFSRIWKMGSREMLNLLPDLTFNDNWRHRRPGKDAAVGRRYLKNVLEALIEKIELDNSNHDGLVVNSYDEIINNEKEADTFGYSLKKQAPSKTNNHVKKKALEINENYEEFDNIEKGDLKLNDRDDDSEKRSQRFNEKKNGLELKALRAGYGTDDSEKKALRSTDLSKEKRKDEIHKKQNKEREEKKKKREERNMKKSQDRRQEQNERRIQEIIDFTDTHYTSTNYLYEEMKRIKTTKVVKGSLRHIVEILEKPDMKTLKQSVFKCFKDNVDLDAPKHDPWLTNDLNNLIIDILYERE